MADISSNRALADLVRRDLARKLVLLTGARQAGKTTLARQLMAGFESAQYLNWDVPADRRLIVEQAWSPRSALVVFDEIHKMRD
ncbi:MAG: AAA family ATPase, partial [Rhizobacter sp.]|nr:AAA family ATPase [Rhizobacter sp.]